MADEDRDADAEHAEVGAEVHEAFFEAGGTWRWPRPDEITLLVETAEGLRPLEPRT